MPTTSNELGRGVKIVDGDITYRVNGVVLMDKDTGLPASGVRQLSCDATVGGTSQSVAISTASAQSTAITTTRGYVLVSPTVNCFVRQGANPTALSNGTDMFLFAGQTLRVSVTTTNKLAFITSTGTGTVYITPDA